VTGSGKYRWLRATRIISQAAARRRLAVVGQRHLALRDLGAGVYWAGAVVLVVVGFLAIFSIGAPLLLTGVAMLVVGRWRHRPAVVWPVLVGVWSFVVGYVLVAPLGCSTTSATLPGEAGRTTCSNVVGIDYSGTGVYNPSLYPALMAGLAVAAIGVVVTRQITRRRGGRGA